MRMHSDLRWPVEEIHEHDEAILLVHVEDGGDEAIEGPAGHLHPLAGLIWARRTDYGAVYLARLEAFDESVVKEARAVAAAHQRAHTVRRENRPPALKVRVHAHEQNSGEERILRLEGNVGHSLQAASYQLAANTDLLPRRIG